MRTIQYHFPTASSSSSFHTLAPGSYIYGRGREEPRIPFTPSCIKVCKRVRDTEPSSRFDLHNSLRGVAKPDELPSWKESVPLQETDHPEPPKISTCLTILHERLEILPLSRPPIFIRLVRHDCYVRKIGRCMRAEIRPLKYILSVCIHTGVPRSRATVCTYKQGGGGAEREGESRGLPCWPYYSCVFVPAPTWGELRPR